jgi:hypothetical protein
VKRIKNDIRFIKYPSVMEEEKKEEEEVGTIGETR